MKGRLVLFDIDGTLVSTGEAGTRALNRAFLELFGLADAFQGISMAGKTDVQIIREGLRVNGIADGDGVVEAVVERYIALLRREIDNPRRRVKPGVYEVLDALSGGGIPLGLLTGNLEAGARIKLDPFGLNDYFPSGAFGSDHEDRDMLLPIALERFSRLGIVVPPEGCIVVGDTPRDVRCAKVHGARCIAVATGPYSREALLEAGADLAVESLSERDRCLAFIERAGS